MPKISPTYGVAGLIAAAIVIYFLFSGLFRGDADTAAAPAAPEQTVAQREVAVVYDVLTAVPHERQVVLRAQTEPNRVVSVRAETAGIIAEASAREGSNVARGTLLCALDVDARAARVAEAEAALEAADLDYKAAKDLAEKGWRSPNQAASALARRNGAEAALKQARIELGNTQMRAPFDGVFERRTAEIGDFLAPGGECGVMTDLDPLVAVAQVSEDAIGYAGPGATAQVRLVDGRVFEGKVTYAARQADPATRTFRVEFAFDNPKAEVPAGLTADIVVRADKVDAHLISPSIMTLGDSGQIGVRYLDEDDFVRFAPIEVVSNDPNGAWVTGLPAVAKVIVIGQEYAREDRHVQAVPRQNEGG
jgi:multidrug efflux system membrane fusion protein